MPSDVVFRIIDDNALSDEASCANRLAEYLKGHRLTISCAESATCGMVAKLLTDKAGSSAWFWGGVETYAVDAKKRLLGVPSEILDESSLGPVSWQCAVAMADGIRKLSGTDMAVSVTGIAGPTGDEPGKPVGTVYFGFSSSSRESDAIRVQVKANDRDGYRRRFSAACLSLALQYAKGEELSAICEKA